MRRYVMTLGIACCLVVGSPAGRAEALPDVFGGIGDLIVAVLVVPVNVVQGTLTGPPILGTVGGALVGAMNSVALTARGALRLTGAAVPMALQAAPYVLPFVL